MVYKTDVLSVIEILPGELLLYMQDVLAIRGFDESSNENCVSS